MILALQCSDHSIALELIKRGADVNAMTLHSHQALRLGGRAYQGETILDLVRGQEKRLREYKSPISNPPELKHGMSEALSKFNEGTWQYAAVKMAARLAERDNEQKLKYHEEEEERRIASLEGVQMKQTAIDSAIDILKQIEREVLARGGKTFQDLYPEYRQPNIPSQQVSWQPPQESPEFKAKLSFHLVSDLTEKRKAKYIEL